MTIRKEGYQPFQDRLRIAVGEEKRLDFLLGATSTPSEEAFQRGLTAYGKGDLDEARASFEEATRLAPESAEAHTNLGLVYLQLSLV